MNDFQLNNDEYSLYQALPLDGSTQGNIYTRRLLGWGTPRYLRARTELIRKKAVVVGPGGGGSLRRAHDGQASLDPGDSPIETVGGVSIPSRVREIHLYGPLVETLSNFWSHDTRSNSIVVEDTSSQGRRVTGGRWTRPDIVSVNLKKYDYLPGKYIEIVSFEVKPADQINVTAVYEALAHRRSVTHAYVLLHIPQVRRDSLADDLESVRLVAAEHGVGVITFGDQGDYSTWSTVEPAVRVDTTPERLNDFIETQLSSESKQKIARSVADYR
ncbi:hypothetical protein QNA23_16685 [Rhodococcus erythropolis]|uniref:hypothetical protein n=1 Tax=Rhodococcus erythropolis TaxID=1833 RepID=UPI0024BB8801|nr:hypothetical protein [Rhodococcus erythropolis]MDJ0405132.1 hypothetical protein [Rhodococcus erythropolis]